MAVVGGVRLDRPLEQLRLTANGPAALTRPLSAHLGLAGIEVQCGAGDEVAEVRLSGAAYGEQAARITWSSRSEELSDEATVQAATGIMAVHGRRAGEPHGLAADFASTAAGVLAAQGLFAGLLGQLRGTAAGTPVVGVDRAALVSVSQYLAAAGAEDEEVVLLGPGGPPFTSGDGVVFELETLDPRVWSEFWTTLDAPGPDLRSGWRPFQFRYAAACAPLPQSLHDCAGRHPWSHIQAAAASSGADVCRLHRVEEWTSQAAPWDVVPGNAGGYRPQPGALPHQPLAGFTVLEAGRRIQAPLAAHLLRLLGADVLRIEPPGGDPLRGMPPSCSGVSARWLALNRGKRSVEVDIKSAAGRAELHELVAGADVFLHNWAPGKAAELRLDADDLMATNPALVFAYTSGWAGRLQDPPLGTDFMVQARTGIGEAVRPADEVPAPSLMTLLDVLGGLLGAEAVLAGLLVRERTGQGVRTESSLLAAAELLLAPAVERVRRGESARRPAGFRRPLRTADGWVATADASADAGERPAVDGRSTAEAVAHLQDRGLEATAVTLDLAALEHDPRFGALVGRDSHGALAVPDPWSFS